ncbi:hypothetical protein XENOCAPTIV_023809 [Xenoophorus captivus]|uniref:Uncharacterized protein n=1 Tax=Xenoophorus captivus TaxID=1517983 RepID=A0ABV0S2Z3_9TELE
MMGVERTYQKLDRETTTSRLYGLTAWKTKSNSRVRQFHMDQAVISYDLEQKFYGERRKKETGQGAKPPTKASVKAPANPPNRPPPQRKEEPQRRFYRLPASQGPQKEEYDKLSSEEKEALFESRRSGTGGPAK